MFKNIILQTYNNMRFLCQHQSLRHHINSSNNHSCKQIDVIGGHGHKKVTNKGKSVVVLGLCVSIVSLCCIMYIASPTSQKYYCQLIFYLRQFIFFLCFNFTGIHYHTQKQRKNKNFLRSKNNFNINIVNNFIV